MLLNSKKGISPILLSAPYEMQRLLMMGMRSLLDVYPLVQGTFCLTQSRFRSAYGLVFPVGEKAGFCSYFIRIILYNRPLIGISITVVIDLREFYSHYLFRADSDSLRLRSDIVFSHYFLIYLTTYFLLFTI